VEPSQIAVSAKHVFWVQRLGFQRSVIGRADINGKNVNRRFLTGLNAVDGMAADGTHVWWMNRVSESQLSAATLGRAREDGSVRQPAILRFSYSQNPVGLAATLADVYWTERLPGSSPRRARIMRLYRSGKRSTVATYTVSRAKPTWIVYGPPIGGRFDPFVAFPGPGFLYAPDVTGGALGDGSGGFQRCSVSNGLRVRNFMDINFLKLGGLAADHQFLYWVDSGFVFRTKLVPGGEDRDSDEPPEDTLFKLRRVSDGGDLVVDLR
jgi:hypothetical protein